MQFPTFGSIVQGPFFVPSGMGGPAGPGFPSPFEYDPVADQKWLEDQVKPLGPKKDSPFDLIRKRIFGGEPSVEPAHEHSVPGLNRSDSDVYGDVQTEPGVKTLAAPMIRTLVKTATAVDPRGLLFALPLAIIDFWSGEKKALRTMNVTFPVSDELKVYRVYFSDGEKNSPVVKVSVSLNDGVKVFSKKDRDGYIEREAPPLFESSTLNLHTLANLYFPGIDPLDMPRGSSIHPINFGNENFNVIGGAPEDGLKTFRHHKTEVQEPSEWSNYELSSIKIEEEAISEGETLRIPFPFEDGVVYFNIESVFEQNTL